MDRLKNPLNNELKTRPISKADANFLNLHIVKARKTQHMMINNFIL